MRLVTMVSFDLIRCFGMATEIVSEAQKMPTCDKKKKKEFVASASAFSHVLTSIGLIGSTSDGT